MFSIKVRQEPFIIGEKNFKFSTNGDASQDVVTTKKECVIDLLLIILIINTHTIIQSYWIFMKFCSFILAYTDGEGCFYLDSTRQNDWKRRFTYIYSNLTKKKIIMSHRMRNLTWADFACMDEFQVQAALIDNHKDNWDRKFFSKK